MSRCSVLLWAFMLASATACGTTGDAAIRRTAPVTDTAPPPTDSIPPDDGLDPEELLAEVRDSIAFVVTPTTQGSGVLVEGGYVVTNAHVVDPFAEAWVSFEGESFPRPVDVVGVDPFADIALLGPLDAERDHLDLADSLELAQGEDVYLIGYPGETELEPEVTISSGLVSRLRDYEPFEQTYVQTDAAIAGGQSGGALLDTRGRVIGISGLSFAEEFALALGGPDVRESIDAITAGDTPEYHPIVAEPSVTTGAVDVPDEWTSTLLVVAATDDERTLQLTVPDDAEPTVYVSNLYGDVYLVNQRVIDQAIADDPSLDPEFVGELLESSAPGVYDVAIAAGEDMTIGLGTIRPTGATVSFESSVPLVVYADPDGEQPIEPGAHVSGVIDYFELDDVYLLELTEGDEVEIQVSAGAGDAVLEFVAPGGARDEGYVDDSGTGLYGYDIDETFTAEETGTYRLFVSVNDAVVVGYQLDVDVN